jgi:hypothetical protein
MLWDHTDAIALTFTVATKLRPAPAAAGAKRPLLAPPPAAAPATAKRPKATSGKRGTNAKEED